MIIINTKNEFNNGNLSKDGVTDEQFGANKKIKPTPNQIKVEQIEKFFLDKTHCCPSGYTWYVNIYELIKKSLRNK